ncbi:tRNA-guanine transglycosylase [Halovivax gelatinilyticus]|uniref:tRNA-guanine transglycosylase n=1 Tax=Halovivax gelatinilyticus TaxID=2961597 RepID=UPI0020CA4DA7|nr:tRNA-guanine transglycosylase [Halovivax gelatinilyticus]
MGDARAGKLTIGDSVIETPNLFPVVNFYGGGTENSVYGGGIHRTVKEFMIGADRIGGDDAYAKFFDAVMTSVSSLTDYNVSKERYADYVYEPIKEREVFSPFNGVIFLDSGGFKFLNNESLDGSDFQEDIDQAKVFEIQKRMGGDIIVNLDHPITPSDTHEERLEKARKTGKNIEIFLDLSDEYTGARYLTLHGYNYSMMDAFLTEITDYVSAEKLRSSFDGIALGSLVPMKDNRSALIDAVIDCHEVLHDWGFDKLPLHVLGISSRAVPLLVALGVDTFDSSTYLQNAINGGYFLSLMETVNVNEANFDECDCPVCSSQHMRRWMRGNAPYKKDMLGPVAMHNLIIQKREIEEVRQRVKSGDSSSLVEYIEGTVAQDKPTRESAHRVVNHSLGGYFQ